MDCDYLKQKQSEWEMVVKEQKIYEKVAALVSIRPRRIWLVLLLFHIYSQRQHIEKKTNAKRLILKNSV